MHTEGDVDVSKVPGGWNNALFFRSECRHLRRTVLLGFNLHECDLCQRIWIAFALGAAIGYERRAADRPAGVVTVSIVSIGAALFTIVSAFGFYESPVFWDSSRVSAMIPKGIGFLCAGVIFKAKGGTVRGVTTAASIWLSGAVGTAAGCALYFTACFTALLTIAVLKFGPRAPSKLANDGSSNDNKSKGCASNAGETSRLLDFPLGNPTAPGATYGGANDGIMLTRRRRPPGGLGAAAVMLDW